MSATEQSERALAAAAAGTEVEQLYRAHSGWLLAFLRRRFGGLVAEELVQEAFARVLRSGGDLRHPRAFLARVAINAARDQARRDTVRAHPHASPALASCAEPDQSEAVLLRQIILSLPPDLRKVFLLSRFGGLTYEEIAQRCNLSVKRVEARMTKALAICAALMRT